MKQIFGTKGIMAALMLVSLGACAGNTYNPHIVFVKDKPYWVGDENCVYTANHKTEDSILCHDEDKQPTGIRGPLSEAALKHYYQMQAIAAQRNTGRAVSNWEPQNSSPNYSFPSTPIPQVQPITPPGGNKTVCNRIGNNTICR